MGESTITRKSSAFQHPAYLGESLASEAATPAYLRGHRDGKKDMEIEWLKQGKALFQAALQKAEEITNGLLQAAQESEIAVHAFVLKVENRDKISSLSIVKPEDYVDDKIESLYRADQQISEEYNDDNFRWNYSITYQADSLNTERSDRTDMNLFMSTALNHARHNREACEFLHTSGTFPDWGVTTAFYCAMHYAHAIIFPFTDVGTTYNNLEEYFNAHKCSGDTKHSITVVLIQKKHFAIAEKHKQLKDTAHTARYTITIYQKKLLVKCERT